MRKAFALHGRLAREESGFTLVELLVVVAIIGILLAIAVPSFLGFEQRAYDAAARSELRNALPAVGSYRNDNESYAGMTVAALRAYDQALPASFSVLSASGGTYCIRASKNGTSFYKNGPGAPITTTPCS